jgi:RHS repeat-associated protein
MDNLNRLLRAKEGHWDGSTVTDGNAKRDEVWTLDQTGNWELFKRDLNGDLNYTGTNELKDRRTHNVVNELLTRDIDDNSSVNFTLVYDDNGNLTDDGEHYTYEYDAFGRLRKVKNRSTTALVSEYRYNGLGHRIGWHYDVDADGTVESNTDDPWFMFVYDDRWRIVNTYRLEEWAYDAGNPSGSEAKERFVYHQAGLGGRGGSSYIDSVMLRDRDANTAWNDASDGTMEERIYYAQNWRHDVSALITDDGRMIEWVKYSSYGVPMSLPAGDTDSDGDFDSTDASAITGTYDVRKDVNLDGTVDIVDYLDALDINGGLSTQGWSILSNPKWNNRKGYAGYEGDTVLAGTKWHVRHRVLDSELGRWMRRDPLGYVDGRSVYAASRNGGIGYIDPLGLANMKPCPMGGGCGGGTHPVPPPTPTPPGQSPPIVDIPEPGIHECYAKVGLCMAVSPIVRDLMSRLDQCSSSSGGAYTSPKIKCSSDGLGGLYNCGNGGDNEIIITHPITPGTGLSLVATCETLSHELSHALSHCESGLCLQDMDLDEHACWYWACDEAIATSRSGSCCPGGSEYMLYDDYCACIRASVMASMSGSQCTIDQIDWALGFSSCMNTAHSPCPAEASICMANR